MEQYRPPLKSPPYLNPQPNDICESGGSGLLLVVDELGKFLEYATQYPGPKGICLCYRRLLNLQTEVRKPRFS